jgi:septal ring factor EnvC (AmiA/AmiB activator)
MFKLRKGFLTISARSGYFSFRKVSKSLRQLKTAVTKVSKSLRQLKTAVTKISKSLRQLKTAVTKISKSLRQLKTAVTKISIYSNFAEIVKEPKKESFVCEYLKGI